MLVAGLSISALSACSGLGEPSEVPAGQEEVAVQSEALASDAEDGLADA